MAGISTRQGTHHVAQMFTSVTLPRYRSRSDTESPLARSTARNSGAVAPTCTGATSLPTRVRMVAPAATPATINPTNIHCFDMVSSHPHGAAAREVAHRGRGVCRAAHRGAGDEGVRPGAPGVGDGVGGDPAVHLERRRGPAAVEQGADPADLVGGPGEVRLAAVPRVDRHHEHEVEIGHDLLDVIEGRGGIERESGPHPVLPDRRELALDVDRSLGVEGEHGGAGIRVFREVVLGLLDHEVNVERPVGDAPERADHRCAEAEVGHEVTVHNIHVNPLRAAGHCPLHLLAEPPQIGAQDAGGDPGAHEPPPGGPLTTRSTAEPRGRPLPGAGRVAITTPASGSPPRTVSTRPTFTPAATTTFSAVGSANPITSGTVAGAGPLLGASCTMALGRSAVPGGGSCQTPPPRGTDVLGRSPSTRDRNPAFVIAARASSSGWASTRGPACSSRRTRRTRPRTGARPGRGRARTGPTGRCAGSRTSAGCAGASSCA